MEEEKEKQQMQDENSLYHEIKHLISIRADHPALQNRSEIQFIYVADTSCPLAYLRSSKDEKIMVILNPSDKEASFSCDYLPIKPLYSLGGEVQFTGDTAIVPASSAGFYLL